ncbi:MAG: S1C family serine protease [Chloroflexota bacterium]
MATQGILATLSAELAAVTAKAGASVVRVNGGRRMPASGTIWAAEGAIVTADHALEAEEGITVVLPEGKELAAELVGRDHNSDLAVLRIEASGLPAIEQAPSGAARVGSLVLALGRSVAGGEAATLGVISALWGPWRTWRGGRLEGLVLSDVSLFPGFSGGPLVDPAGRAIGVNSSLLARGVGAALPAELVERTVRQLLSQGRMRRGYLGVSTYPVPLPQALAQQLGLQQKTGLLVNVVEPGSPAERAGLLLGDVLLALGDQPLRDGEDLQALLGPEQVGLQVAIRIVRAGESRELPATVGERP